MFDASPRSLDVTEIIRTHYPPGSKAYDILMRHGELVAAKALAVADRVGGLRPDRDFLVEAAFLHDIGICGTDTPELGCRGSAPYLRHGVIGREMLESRGLLRHAMVCERHVGVGITREEVRANRLPLPDRDMVPVSLEEEIVCYADKFFSKAGNGFSISRTVEEVRAGLARFAPRGLQVFDRWTGRFESPPDDPPHDDP